MVDRARLLTLPAMAGVDALVAVSPENFTYVSGSYIFTTKTLPPRQAFAVLFAQGEPAVLVCGMERSHPEEESWIRDIHVYVEFVQHPMDALAGLLLERGLARACIGIDLQFLPHASYLRLVERMPDARFIDTTDEVARLRSVKSAEEVAIIERASLSTHDAAIAAMGEARLGESEKLMADRLLFNLIRNGADGTTFLVFGSGPRSSMTHALPTDRVPGLSEILRFDFGGSFGPWQSDFARTYSTGEPTAHQQETYRALRKVQSETIGMIRAGVTAQDVFQACKEAFARHGLKFVMPHVGHGFGIELHETPMLRAGNTTLLEPGMVLNVEPITMDDDGSGYQLEDLVLVTETGSRLLTRGLPPQEIPVIGVFGHESATT